MDVHITLQVDMHYTWTPINSIQVYYNLCILNTLYFHTYPVNVLSLIEILVPVTGTLLVVILLMACIIIVMCIRQRLLTRGHGSVYHFQPMSLSYDDGNDDDDGNDGE